MIRWSAETGFRALVAVFLLSCTFLAASYNTTFAFDHPIHSSALTCLLSATSLLILSRFVDRIPKISPAAHKYSAIPLTEHDQPTAEAPPPIGLDDDLPVTKSRIPRWLKVAVLSGIGCARVALYRSITVNIECAPTGYAFSVPFLVALYDFWRNQRRRPAEKWASPDYPQNIALRLLVTLTSRVRFFVLQSRMRYVISAAFLAASGLLAASFHDGAQSTYICPILSRQALLERAFRILSVILDCLILAGAAELASERTRAQDGKGKQMLLSWGYGFLGVTVFGAIWAIYETANTKDYAIVTSHYLRSALGQAVLVTIVMVSASQLMPYYGVAGLCVLAGFVSNYSEWSSVMLNGQEPFPLILPSRAFAALFFGFVGGLIFLCARAASDDEPQFLCRFNRALRLIFLLMFGIGLIWVFNQPGVSHLHPIDLLIYDARQNHDTWVNKAKGSHNLAEAVHQYQKKYKQLPPPGFDKWYDYAVTRSSVAIDEFDQIHSDLLPFRALPPAQLRALTQKLATNPFNNIGALSIRNGTVRIQEGIKPTHAWMVESAAKMIEKFSEHLPDMDLAFNLDDEPRVVVPWKKMAELRSRAVSRPLPPENHISDEWSMDRSATWAPIEPADQTPQRMFVDSSFQNIFDRYVSPACPPGSKARSQRIWDRHHLCLSCIHPHSMGQFPTDWAVATDICHQPDLATLHGFFLSPSTFRVTQELVPVFSQSSISGFSDIMFPSPWNYVDKAKYDPSDEHPDPDYADKDNTLFWIGSTTEGLSHDGRWKGMPRQRLAHLVNNNTYNQVSVLLPADKPDTYSYQILDGRAPLQTLGLNASVSITDPIVRCWFADCDDQKAELGTGPRIDFQSHWQHRYLFDLDGAGFSGRFLPFLQSHSLPFKTGLFRHWFDSRLSPWLHFVPIDLRLHGLWSTLAYFSGVDVTTGQHKIKMEPHDLEGRWIAEEGRKWAATALRKEDMEIYFFRLLLEWGRLTDDRRDLLGFKV